MKTTVEQVKLTILVLFVFHVSFSISFTLYSGSWCPYQEEKVVPCRVRNGSEPYYGPNICWRNDNGSYSCTKKILYRPKYTTTYKKITETKYKCCPGLDGPQCENECFNCTAYRKLSERVGAAEKRLSRLEKSFSKTSSSTPVSSSPADRLDRFHREFAIHNSVLPPTKDFNTDPSASLAYATLNLRVHTLLEEFRDMQNRIRLLENEVSRLNLQVDDLTLSQEYNNNAARRETTMGVNKDVLTDQQISNHDGIDTNQQQAGDHFSTPSNRHSTKSEGIFRVLEENLERGDIASTLNDDYGDELYSDNSTEQYLDQLQLKRERHHSP